MTNLKLYQDSLPEPMEPEDYQMTLADLLAEYDPRVLRAWIEDQKTEEQKITMLENERSKPDGI
mgnify:FL=1